VFFILYRQHGQRLFTGQKRTYPIYFKSTGTLEKGAPVKQAGYDVGEVIGIALKTIMEPTPTFYIIVDISVNKDAHIAYDSKASIQTMGMMEKNTSKYPSANWKKHPKEAESTGKDPRHWIRVMADANDLIKEIYKNGASLNVIFADAAFQQNITHLIANLEQFSREVTELLAARKND
jgi:ABC-type transporter Mla subunit MlaD